MTPDSFAVRPSCCERNKHGQKYKEERVVLVVVMVENSDEKPTRKNSGACFGCLACFAQNRVRFWVLFPGEDENTSKLSYCGTLRNYSSSLFGCLIFVPRSIIRRHWEPKFRIILFRNNTVEKNNFTYRRRKTIHLR